MADDLIDLEVCVSGARQCEAADVRVMHCAYARRALLRAQVRIAAAVEELLAIEAALARDAKGNGG